MRQREALNDLTLDLVKLNKKKNNVYVILGDGEIQAFGTMSTERPSSYSGYTITFAYGDVTTTFKYDVIIKSEIHSYTINERIWQTYYVN